MTDTKTPFLTDVKTLRERARQHLDQGAVTSTYKGDARKTIEILQSVLATEIVCVLRRSEEHTSELQSLRHLVCRLLLEKKKKKIILKISVRKNCVQQA